MPTYTPAHNQPHTNTHMHTSITESLSFDCHLILFPTSFNITILSRDINEVDLSLGIIIFNCAIS